MDSINKGFFCRYSPWIILTIALYGSAFVYLFVENFIFSSNLDLTAIREVDDYAFQLYLRKSHESAKFFRLNAYAYGWIFWFPIVCLTYPFYLLSIYFGIDVPLIVIPRQLSLLFTMGTAIILYKIASLYTKDSFIKSVILLLYLSFPATGYFALRFGTVSQTMFLSAFAYYFAAKKDFLTQKDLHKIAIAVAAAAATKLSALLITPLITLVILDRLSWKFNKENITYLIKSFFVFLFSLFILSQMSPKGVIAQIKQTQTSSGVYSGIYDSFLNGIVSTNLHIVVFLFLFLGLLGKAIMALTNYTKFLKKDFLYIVLCLVISIAYLLFSIKMGSLYITIYFTVISFLLPLGIIILDHTNIYLRYIVSTLLLVLNIFLNFNTIFSTSPYSLSWNVYYTKAADPTIVKGLAIQELLKTKLKNPSEYKNKLKILRDYQTPSPYSSFRNDVLETSVYSNIGKISAQQEYDLIGLYKKGIAFIPDPEFNKLINNVDPVMALQYKNHRKIIQDLLINKQFNNINYEILLDEEDYIYFVRISRADE